jgi:hypothetical protein
MKIEGTNLSMVRGDSETITISCFDDEGEKINLQYGDTIYFTVKLNTQVEQKLIQKIITVFDGGNAIIDIEPEDTKALSYRSYRYDIQWVSSEGRVVTIIRPSIFTIEPEVTYEY